MKKAIRWIILVLVVGAIVGIAVFSMSRPVNHSDAVWNEGTTLGRIDARNHYITFTDLACPYCDVFSRTIIEHEEEFKRDYIEKKDILYEVRVTDFLYEYGSHGSLEMSRWSAEGVYCARNEGKFWEYYDAAVMALWRDYQSKGIGASKESPMIEGMTQDYWIQIGREIGLADGFESCMTEHKMVPEIEANTARAAKQVQGGVPYFKFGKFTTSGFDPSWGWSYVKKYLDAGL